MSPLTTYRRVVLPQAARVVVPPTANEVISMLKLTSLVLVIGLADLTTTVQLIYGRNFQQIPLLIVASIWYLVLTTILTLAAEPARDGGSAGATEPRGARAAPRWPRPGGTVTAAHMVEAVGVRKHFGGNEVLKGIDLTVDRGEVVSMLGPSGSGKSTFLRCINHLEPIDGGEISVNG